MRLALAFLWALALPCMARCQDSTGTRYLRRDEVYREFALLAGYAYTFDTPRSSRFHVLEVGVARAFVAKGHHFASGEVHWSNELLLKGDAPVWGPKLGFTGGIGVFFIGADLVYYTDFTTGSLRFVPCFGMGSYPIMIGLRPHVRLAGNDDLLANDTQLAVVLRVFPFARKYDDVR